jgi:hypothetical protein
MGMDTPISTDDAPAVLFSSSARMHSVPNEHEANSEADLIAVVAAVISGIL